MLSELINHKGWKLLVLKKRSYGSACTDCTPKYEFNIVQSNFMTTEISGTAVSVTLPFYVPS